MLRTKAAVATHCQSAATEGRRLLSVQRPCPCDLCGQVSRRHAGIVMGILKIAVLP
jgi:hypothetical protein